jgi:Tfp pilus assembly protein PilN
MTFFTGTQRLPARSGIPSVRLSVAPRTIHVMRAIQWGLSCLLICASLLTGWMWWETRTVEEEATRYTTAADRTDALNRQFTAQLERDQLTLTASQMAVIQQDVRFVNQLAEKRGFLWTQLLSDLEEAVPAGISIRTIHRDEKTSTITIDGHATSMGTLQTLMTTLEARPAFRQPVLHQHQLVESSHADKGGEREAAGVEFSVTVQYHGIFKNTGTHDVS